MSLSFQIFLGSVFLLASSLIHVAMVALSIPVFRKIAMRLSQKSENLRIMAMLCFGLMVIVVSHTVQIWLWATSFYVVGAFDSFAANFYFTTVTYTTLGYGDLVLGEGLRIFATFSSITGMLAFGISTAFLLGLIIRLIPSFSEFHDT